MQDDSPSSYDSLAIVRTVALMVAWLVVVAVMIRVFMLASTEHDSLGVLIGGLELVSVEFALLLEIVRPWSYRRSWARSASAFLMFMLIGSVGTLLAMHAGGILAVHALWALGIAGIFGLLTVWSTIAALSTRVRSGAPHYASR